MRQHILGQKFFGAFFEIFLGFHLFSFLAFAVAVRVYLITAKRRQEISQKRGGYTPDPFPSRAFYNELIIMPHEWQPVNSC